jgi:glycosyltransferase involved in cell wall biosynthesis
MKHPTISVLLPVLNGEKYLAEAIDSVLAQSFGDFELIILDDGSTDATPEIIAGVHDERVRPFPMKHCGLVAALNYGVSQARAEWIARQDADDVSHPRRLEQQWAAVRGADSSVLSYTSRETLCDGIVSPWPGHFPRSRALLALQLCYMNPITHSTVLFRKSTFLAVGGYSANGGEDYALWGNLLEHGESVGIPERLLRYRVHAGSDSAIHAERNRASTEIIGLSHCVRFLRLPPAEAARAHRVLLTPASERAPGEWGWFLLHCVPRLRWRNIELYAWLASQTLRGLRTAS